MKSVLIILVCLAIIGGAVRYFVVDDPKVDVAISYVSSASRPIAVDPPIAPIENTSEASVQATGSTPPSTLRSMKLSATSATPSTAELPAPLLDIPDPQGFFNGQGSADPQLVANATLGLDQFVLTDSNYVSESAHLGLYNDLSYLARTADDVAKDAGTDPVASMKLRSAFSDALTAAIDRTDRITQRGTELAVDIAKTHELKALLNVAKS